jgi:hypothetical protein
MTMIRANTNNAQKGGWRGYGRKQRTMTNREWLAQMSDKQFIKWLRKYKYETDACGLCEFKGKCSSEDCNECESLWLQQEHKEV